MRPEVRIMLEQARKDLEAAQKNLDIKEFYVSVFLCQQGVEKLLKGLFIITKKRSPGPTHSLIYLAKETGVPERFNAFLGSLTPEYITTRYPDVAGDAPYKLYTEEKARNYLKAAAELMQWFENQIKKR